MVEGSRMGLALRFNLLRDFANVIRDGAGAVIGGIVDLPLDDPQTSGKLSKEIMKTHADESHPQEYEEEQT